MGFSKRERRGFRYELAYFAYFAFFAPLESRKYYFMNYLSLAKKYLETLVATTKTIHGGEISDISEKRVASTETRFTRATDPYRAIGAKNYWKMHVTAPQRPLWVKELYGLD